MSTSPAVCVHMQDLLGLCSLVKRSPTLDGQVPLRAAQGCQPLLEGNALGFQVVLNRPLRLEIGWAGPKVSIDDDTGRSFRAALPWLESSGTSSAWLSRLSKGVALKTTGRLSLSLWTGLLVRPEPGRALWLGPSRNRRNPMVDVAQGVFPDAGGFTPLLLELTFHKDARDLLLTGELASLIPVVPGVTTERVSLQQAKAAGQAHLDFYGPEYFQEKKARVTTRYRREMAKRADAPEASTGMLQVVEAGPVRMEVTPVQRVMTPHGVSGPSPGILDVATFQHPVGLSALWDGHAMQVELDEAALKSGAALVAKTWRAVFGDDVMARHEGALLYLTRYLNLHPPGEPWFFVKPWALGVTPPGWSLWLEGVGGPSFDLLRGVVKADSFHAMPAVFHMWKPGERVVVEAGTPMVQAIPFPRSLALEGMEMTRPLAF